jgi:TRAP-type C4-dicarboxylate transport system substrate-binding protein
MMKQKRLLIVAGILCLGLMVAFLPFEGPYAQPKVITLKMANFFPPVGKQTLINPEFIEEIEKRTAGRVKITFYPGGTLLSAPAMSDGIIKGITDIGYTHVEYTPGRFPVTEVCDMPLGYPSAWVAAQCINDFYQRFKPKEWDVMHPLYFNASNPPLVICRKPVRKLEDLKGLIIRAPGRVGDVIKALGGTPAPTPMVEVYESIAKGVNDGVFTPYETLKTFKFGEVVKYTTVSWQVGNTYAFFLAMNKDTWKKLPPDIQAIFNEVAGIYRERSNLMWNSIDFEGLEFAKAKGIELIELSPEEAVRWKKAAEPAIDVYVKEMVGRGYKEDEVRGWIKFLRDRLDYWTKKQIEWRIPSPTGPKEMRPESILR